MAVPLFRPAAAQLAMLPVSPVALQATALALVLRPVSPDPQNWEALSKSPHLCPCSNNKNDH
jgi:hypothetical protein